MNLAKKGQIHFSLFKVDSQNPRLSLEYLTIYFKNKGKTKKKGQKKWGVEPTKKDGKWRKERQQICK